VQGVRRRLERFSFHAMRMLITGVPTGVAVSVITAVCATLTMFGFLMFGALTDTEIGPYLQQMITVSIAVPMIVMIPFTSVAIRLIREFESERARAMALAASDSLTGLHNRRRLLEMLERDVGLARRMRRPLLIAMIDVDDFKSVNDEYGHATGDQLLRAIAATCLRCTRTTDVVGRWGGEEFVLLLPDTGAEGGLILLERLRTEVAATVIRDEAGNPLIRTISIGAIVLLPSVGRSHTATVQQLLEEADRAMYRAKVGGKDRVVLERPRETAGAVPSRERQTPGRSV